MVGLRAQYESQLADRNIEAERMRQELDQLRQTVKGLGQEARGLFQAAGGFRQLGPVIDVKCFQRCRRLDAGTRQDLFIGEGLPVFRERLERHAIGRQSAGSQGEQAKADSTEAAHGAPRPANRSAPNRNSGQRSLKVLPCTGICGPE